MIITLEELNAAATQLPDATISVHAGRHTRQVPILPKITVSSLDDENTKPPMVRIATFLAKEYRENGVVFWRWTPVDEIVIYSTSVLKQQV